VKEKKKAIKKSKSLPSTNGLRTGREEKANPRGTILKKTLALDYDKRGGVVWVENK